MKRFFGAFLWTLSILKTFIFLCPVILIAQSQDPKESSSLISPKSIQMVLRVSDPFGLRGSMVEQERQYNEDLYLLSNLNAVRLVPNLPFSVPYIPRFREKPEMGYNVHFEYMASSSWSLLIGIQSFLLDYKGSPFAIQGFGPRDVAALPIVGNVPVRNRLYSSNLYHLGGKYHFLQSQVQHINVDPYVSFRLGYGGYESEIHRSVFQEISRFEPNSHTGTTLGLSVGTGVNLHLSREIGFNIELEYWNLRNRSGLYNSLELELFQWQFGTFMKFPN